MLQQFIAGSVTAGIVDDLEAVEIHVEQGMGGGMGACMNDGAFQPVLEFAAVDQAGKRVVRGLVMKLPVLACDTTAHHVNDQ